MSGLWVVALATAQQPSSDAVWLASDLFAANDSAARGRAAGLLRELATSSPDAVGDALVGAARWLPYRDPPFLGAGALVPAIPLDDVHRAAVARELVLWRLHLVQVGGQEIPDRLDAELHALMIEPMARYGVPTDTRDWLHLYAATGGDPAEVVERLGVKGDLRWEVVVDEDKALDGAPREMLPLLAHRSEIVRARAAERLEETPTASMQAMGRAWRYTPGRQAPLRGPVVAPLFERSEAAADRWAQRLVRWARRSSRQSDDKSLEAALCLLAEPTLTRAMHPTILVEDAQRLMRAARRDEGPRADLIVQGLDAMVRHVTFEEGLDPAPESVVPEEEFDPFAEPAVAFDWEYDEEI